MKRHIWVYHLILLSPEDAEDKAHYHTETSNHDGFGTDFFDVLVRGIEEFISGNDAIIYFHPPYDLVLYPMGSSRFELYQAQTLSGDEIQMIKQAYPSAEQMTSQGRLRILAP